MTNNEVIIDGLSCYNCPEKERCEIQKRQKNEVIDLIIDRIHKITNYDSCITPHIKKLKSVIPTVTRCDVVLEKQLQRKTQECEKMKEENEELEKLLTKEPMALQALRAGYTAYKTDTKVFSNLLERYKSALDEIENKLISYCETTCGSCYKECIIYGLLDIITKAKEQE